MKEKIVGKVRIPMTAIGGLLRHYDYHWRPRNVQSTKEENHLLKEAVDEGVITCPKCGNKIEPDAEKCYCGWVNPLMKEGYI